MLIIGNWCEVTSLDSESDTESNESISCIYTSSKVESTDFWKELNAF